MMRSISYLLCFYILCYVNLWIVEAQVDLCISNCASSDRLVGPTRPAHTRPHPWIPSSKSFDAAGTGFCKLGCSIFFTDTPKNTTCKNLCGYYYRYRITAQYSDLAEQAKLECQDGCDIALEVCQAGYFCNDGIMLPCPAGTYRLAISNISSTELTQAHNCTLCPYGRYRSTTKGKSADDCTECPIGTYNDKLGSTSPNDCLRCPAGMNAEQPGMRNCKCITNSSCGVEILGKEYYSNGVDYYRETVPFIERW